MKPFSLGYRVLGTVAGLLALTAFAAPDAFFENRSVWSGVYTPAQAERGAATFQASCAGCHMPDLSGRGTAIPALRGDVFTGARHGQTVADFYGVVSTTMPPGRAASLSPEQYVDIVAFVLSQNAFPPGDSDLVHHDEVLQGILFDEGVVAD